MPREGADLREIVMELSRDIRVAESPVVEEVENMVVAYLVADNLHVEKLRARVGNEVELTVLCECLKARILCAAEYGHYVIERSAVVVHSQRLDNRSYYLAHRLFYAVGALLGYQLNYTRDKVGGVDSEKL